MLFHHLLSISEWEIWYSSHLLYFFSITVLSLCNLLRCSANPWRAGVFPTQACGCLFSWVFAGPQLTFFIYRLKSITVRRAFFSIFTVHACPKLFHVYISFPGSSRSVSYFISPTIFIYFFLYDFFRFKFPGFWDMFPGFWDMLSISSLRSLLCV